MTGSTDRSLRLTDLGVGQSGVIASVDAGVAQRLMAHGIRSGSLITVEGDAPFAGPRIVRVGGARLALARQVAARIAIGAIETVID